MDVHPDSIRCHLWWNQTTKQHHLMLLLCRTLPKSNILRGFGHSWIEAWELFSATGIVWKAVWEPLSWLQRYSTVFSAIDCCFQLFQQGSDPFAPAPGVPPESFLSLGKARCSPKGHSVQAIDPVWHHKKLDCLGPGTWTIYIYTMRMAFWPIKLTYFTNDNYMST